MILPKKRSKKLHLRSLRGQTLVYLLTVMAMMMLMVLWLYDFNTGAVTRIRSQNAADGAALAAAQWQARSLNAVGEINLIKAINTLLENIPPGEELESSLSGLTPLAAYGKIQSALDSLQTRIEFVGPVVGMVAAQQVAKNNGIAINELFTSELSKHAQFVEENYDDGFVDPPQWGAWGDENWAKSYAKMLKYVADEGVAVAADNVKYYGGNFNASPQALFYLFNKAFYQAIAIKDWCFLDGLIMDYQDYTYWGEITPLPQNTYGSEYFGLGLGFTSSDVLVAPGGLTDPQFQTLRNYFVQQLTARNLPLHTDWPQFIPAIRWATHVKETWGTWTKAQQIAPFSLVAAPKAVYDYSGCDAVTAISNNNDLLLALNDHGSGWTSWLVGDSNKAAFSASVGRLGALESSSEFDVKAVAAAKPFGQLASVGAPAYTFRIVLPVYQEVRLIPVATASSFGDSDPEWLVHKLEHLPFNGVGDTVAYTQFGPDSLPGDCIYCQRLKTWEDPSFRQEGIDWLTATDDDGNLIHNCVQQGGGGGGGGGAGGIPIAH